MLPGSSKEKFSWSLRPRNWRSRLDRGNYCKGNSKLIFNYYYISFSIIHLKTVKSKFPDEAPVVEEQIEASFNKEGIHGGLTCAPESDNRIVNGVDAKPRTYV